MKKIISFCLIVLAMLSLMLLSGCYTNEAHTHAFGEWETIKEATCTEDGSKVRACQCGESETEGISATGHIYKYTETVDVDGNASATLVCQGAGCDSFLTETAGLYDAKEILVASWDELINIYGLDIEKDFSQKNLEIDEALLQNIIKNNSKLQEGTKLIVSDSVNRIGDFALFGCSSLTNLVVPSSVTYLGYNAFYACNFEVLYTGTAEEWANVEQSPYLMGTSVLIRYEDNAEFLIGNFIPILGSSSGQKYGSFTVEVNGEKIYIGNFTNKNLYDCVYYDENFEIEYKELETLNFSLISESERQEMSATLDKIKEAEIWYMLRKYENDTYTNKYLVCKVDEAYYFLPIKQTSENENRFSVDICAICRHQFGGYK